MPDVYVTIADAGADVVGPLADILELRAADAQQRAMREAYLADVQFPAEARVLEVGCGPGPVARALAAWPGVGEVVGVDPSPIFLAKARELAADVRYLSFVEGDARSLPLGDDAFDVVVFHTTLCHGRDPSAHSPKPSGSSARAAGWPCSTATTPRPRAPAGTSILCRRAQTRWSTSWCTTAG